MKDFSVNWEKDLLDLISGLTDKNNTSIYFGVDVWKNVLDIWVTMNDSNVQMYLGSIENTAKWFRQIENIIKQIIISWINENNIFFATENTGTYGHDITNFFEDRLPNVYILNSTLTCSARQFYANNNYKNDEIDSIIIATTLRDLDNKWNLESDKNPFKQNKGVNFVRRSFSKQRDTLRMLYRNLASLREEKSRLMTTINMYKERLYPEIRDVFKVKSRSAAQNIVIENFSRDEILAMSECDFLEKYKSIASKWQQSKVVLDKVSDFYNKVIERWNKASCSKIDQIIQKTPDSYILDDIRFKQQYYRLITTEMDEVNQKIWDNLYTLKQSGYFIPSFKGINDNELWIFLWELWNGIYTITAKELMWFIWRHPNNYTSGWWHTVKLSKFSNKESIIKKFIYIWMYGFNMHNPSFRLYKKLLWLYYGINTESDSVTKIKNKRKIEAKAGYKLLEIIHSCYRYGCGFDEERFLNSTIIPLIESIKDKWITTDLIKSEILKSYKLAPRSLGEYCG